MADDLNIARLTSLIGSSANLQKLSFGGIVGRLAWVMCVALFAIAYVAGHAAGTFGLIAVVAIAILVLVMVGVVLYVVKTRPELAILDGSHVINYKQLTIGTKDFTPSGESLPVPDPALLGLNDNAGESET